MPVGRGTRDRSREKLICETSKETRLGLWFDFEREQNDSVAVMFVLVETFG